MWRSLVVSSMGKSASSLPISYMVPGVAAAASSCMERLLVRPERGPGDRSRSPASLLDGER
jgi:hypothetical protein